MELLATHVLSADPNRQHRINANSFQQDAILNHNGWQYACFYSVKDGAQSAESGTSVLLINISRRHVAIGSNVWETLTFQDYEQVTDDGHNTISMGICPEDGTIHLSFDHHCDTLRYRSSLPGLASNPSAYSWESAHFGTIQHALPGVRGTSHIFTEVSYPRFLSLQKRMLFTYRVGKAGAGADVLFRYAAETKKYEYLGYFLVGVNNSPYINGVSYDGQRVHVSGCFRGFVEYDGANSTTSTAHKAQAGPNGPENNHDLFYAFSPDNGDTWKNSGGQTIASMKHGESILPDSRGFVVFEIARNTGVLNQEAQACDDRGGFHALNRENEVWIHYYRSPSGRWSKHPISQKRPTRTGSRGSIVALGAKLLLVLPGNRDNTLTILRCDVLSDSVGTHEICWEGDGFDGEPQLDVFAVRDAYLLSVYTRTAGHARKVVVLDFKMGK